jgi:hypothetical protein
MENVGKLESCFKPLPQDRKVGTCFGQMEISGKYH